MSGILWCVECVLSVYVSMWGGYGVCMMCLWGGCDVVHAVSSGGSVYGGQSRTFQESLLLCNCCLDKGSLTEYEVCHLARLGQ